MAFTITGNTRITGGWIVDSSGSTPTPTSPYTVQYLVVAGGGSGGGNPYGGAGGGGGGGLTGNT